MHDSLTGETGQGLVEAFMHHTHLLVGNALLHAYGPVSLTVVRREVICCQVRDGSRKLPQLRPAQTTDEFGRGLRLVDQMASKWGADPTPWGKEVWFELPEAPDPLAGGWD
ncbi:ATP-binding protein [Streptomyces sp. NPDC019208]|uniref:ATP-binding protein n=1 Tax=Streptomyces sp. NPDC019208 TaxID=3154683 RepID=UPI0033F76C3E